MATEYSGSSFGEDDQEVLGRAYDDKTETTITVISCPEQAIGGDGPVFESIDNKSVYVLVSDEFVERQVNASPDKHLAAIQYGMMLGDVLRRGIYFAQQASK